MTIRPYKSRWQVDVPTPNKRHRKVVDTHAEAVELERHYLNLRRAPGEYAALTDVLAKYGASLRTRAKPTTVRVFEYARTSLLEFYGHTSDVSQWTLSDIDRFVDNRRQAGWKPRSINTVLAFLRASLYYAVELRMLSTMPVRVKRLKGPKQLVTALTLADVEALVHHAEDDETRLAILLGAHAGLRHREVVHLLARDWDPGEGVVRVTAKEWPGGSWSPKSYQERAVPASPKLAAALTKTAPAAGWIFPSPQDPTQPRYGMAHQIRRAFERAGLYDETKRTGMHMLRRTFATELLGRGVDIRTVMELGGWSSLEVVQRYVGTTDDRKRAAIGGTFA